MDGALEKYVQKWKYYKARGEWINSKPKESAAIVKETPPTPPPNITEEDKKIVETIIKEAKELPIEIEFDEELFLKRVREKVVAKYGESNPATIAYMATDIGMQTPCLSLAHAKGYWSMLVALYENYFQWKWGYGYAEALRKVEEAGTPNCESPCFGWKSLKAKALNLGDDFYSSLLSYENKSKKYEIFKRAVELHPDWKDWQKKMGKSTVIFIGGASRFWFN